KRPTATGNVAKVRASERMVVLTLADGSESRFVWTADTKINGTLAPGAKVTVRYTSLPDGQNLAHQISVWRGFREAGRPHPYSGILLECRAPKEGVEDMGMYIIAEPCIGTKD